MTKAGSLPKHCKRTEDGEHARLDPESNFIGLFHGVCPYRDYQRFAGCVYDLDIPS